MAVQQWSFEGGGDCVQTSCLAHKGCSDHQNQSHEHPSIQFLGLWPRLGGLCPLMEAELLHALACSLGSGCPALVSMNFLLP